MIQIPDEIKRALIRGLRAFVAGAIASMSMILFTGNGWRDMGVWLNGLAMAGIVGGISGFLMMMDKFIRDTKIPKISG